MRKEFKEFLSLIFGEGTYVPFKPKFDIKTRDRITVQKSASIAKGTIEVNFSYTISKEFIAKLQQDASLNNIGNKLIKYLNEKKYNETDAILGEFEKDEKFKSFYQHFIGTLVSNDLALIYRDKTITGSIYLPNGQTAFISAKIDEFGNIGMLDINVFDNIFDMAAVANYNIKDNDVLFSSSDGHITYSSYKIGENGIIEMSCYKDFDNIFDIDAIVNYEDDGIGTLISYNDIDKQIEFLTGKGINPDLSMQIDFNQMLIERHCSDLKNYMWQIYRCKDTIIGKIQEAMQSEKIKVK